MNKPENPSHGRWGEHHWSLMVRIGFRFSFIYFILYLFGNGNVTLFTPIDRIPWVGDRISRWLNYPFQPATQWIGIKLFHLSGIAASWHAGGSGDTAQNWLQVALLISIALCLTVAWSLLDRKRVAYPKLYEWLRFIMRLTVGITMLWYGLDKVFPIQMQPPTLGVLNEPFGQMSPFSLLWSTIGAFPAYERICGCVEVCAGLLLLNRSTALAGALVTSFVMTNVLLYNLFFDVPVKLFAAHLVIVSLFLLLPDVKPLFRFFVLNRTATPRGTWKAPLASARMLRAMTMIEVCYVIFTLCSLGNDINTRWRLFQAARTPSPLDGSWEIRNEPSGQLRTPEGRPWTNIYFDNTYRAMVRDTSGQLWRYNLKYDVTHQTLEMRGPMELDQFEWKVDDPSHIRLRLMRAGPIVMADARVSVTAHDTLRSVPVDSSHAVTLQLDRMPTAQSYFIYDRGFHFVNEWPYEH